VERLARAGFSASSIAAETGIPRGTVWYWLRGEVPRLADRKNVSIARAPSVACLDEFVGPNR
jgi:hypothetical protein